MFFFKRLFKKKLSPINLEIIETAKRVEMLIDKINEDLKEIKR